MNNKEEVRAKIVEILGLEIDKEGNENMLLIRNAKGKILYGLDYTEEVDELEKLNSRGRRTGKIKF